MVQQVSLHLGQTKSSLLTVDQCNQSRTAILLLPRLNQTQQIERHHAKRKLNPVRSFLVYQFVGVKKDGYMDFVQSLGGRHKKYLIGKSHGRCRGKLASAVV